LPSLSRKTESLLIVFGAVLFSVGALWRVASPHAPATQWICWLGLILLTAVAIFRRSLTFWIFVALLIGLEIGLDYPQFATHLRFLSDIFLRLIKLIVAPLILGTLITGIAGHGDLRKVGRIGLKSFLYFEIVTTVALFIGVAAINISQAGKGLVIPASAADALPVASAAPLHWDDFLLHAFPDNIVKAAAENQILQVAVFAILFGIALSRVPQKYREPLLSLAESLSQTMFRFTNIVMYYAPIGVGAAMAYTVGHMGISVLLPLAKLLITAYVALLVFLLLVLLPITVFSRVPLRKFLAAGEFRCALRDGADFYRVRGRGV